MSQSYIVLIKNKIILIKTVI